MRLGYPFLFPPQPMAADGREIRVDTSARMRSTALDTHTTRFEIECLPSYTVALERRDGFTARRDSNVVQGCTAESD